jgi:nitroreductase
MEFKEVIKNRKSIRSFEEKPVPKRILKELIKDATKAPSTQNSQPWSFYII